MREYAKIVRSLRICADGNCPECDYWGEAGNGCYFNLKEDAADAIEELLATARSVVHCKDCEWWTKQDASIQGRCARFGFYPTGKFYCASGSMAEPPKGVE